MSEFAEALLESYADQLRKWFSIEIVALAVLLVLLFWSGKHGHYESTLLSLAHTSLKSLVSEDSGLSSLPVYVPVISIIWASVFLFIFDVSATQYFRFVLTRPRIAGSLTKMQQDQLGMAAVRSQSLVADLHDAEAELQSRREGVQAMVKWSKACFLGAIGLGTSAIWGNVLDTSIAGALLVLALGLLYRSVGVFIRKVGPQIAVTVSMQALLLSK